MNAGVILAGEGLHPSSKGVRVIFEKGKKKVIDGPFAETKELVAGFWLWQVKSMEEAVDWVKRMPQQDGSEQDIEIRPVLEADDFGENLTPELRAVIEHNPHELLLGLEGVENTKTKTRHPQTNGICERFHRTILNEFYQVAFRKKVYDSLESLQADLDEWLKEYNEHRPHTGRWCFGKTPMETFKGSLHIAKEKMTGYEDPVSDVAVAVSGQ